MIEQAGGEALFVRVDVSKAGEIEALVRKVVDTYGRLDCAFNNAGISTGKVSTVDLTEEQWDLGMNINLKSVWLCMKYEIPQMLRQGGGVIVNTSSIAGLHGKSASSSLYVASKHGVAGLTKAVALEYAQAGIRVNAVCPGPTRTPMTEKPGMSSEAREKALAADKERVPLGRRGEPEELAEAVVWLCSDAASFVTGHMMAVDGGLGAQ
jgi:NAD(P)-dependent dehydrogenase (short-subunit alcohol dehydrogenase family)